MFNKSSKIQFPENNVINQLITLMLAELRRLIYKYLYITYSLIHVRTHLRVSHNPSQYISLSFKSRYVKFLSHMRVLYSYIAFYVKNVGFVLTNIFKGVKNMHLTGNNSINDVSFILLSLK